MEDAKSLDRRLLRELGLSESEELTDELLGKISPNVYDGALIKVMTTREDGTLREGIKYGTSAEVIAALQRDYGNQLTPEQYELLGAAYQRVVFDSNARKAITTGVIIAATDKGPIGDLFRGQIKQLLEKQN
jgi:hypothetical protein